MSNTFFMLVGLPGSGKTTISKYLEQEGVFRVSSDDYRKIFSPFKDDHEFIFSVMNYTSLQALKKRNVVYDSTNLSIINRKNTYEYVKEYDSKSKVVIICLDYGAEFAKKIVKKRPERTDVTDNLIDYLNSYYEKPIVGIDCDVLINLPLSHRNKVMNRIKDYI
ncbi:ATP-binding protein [Enterococcus sp.]|uniref:ATP-binding protein n=1 Tax=Enterococcus sp. TaxID=35783 RepID=UPI002FCA381E